MLSSRLNTSNSTDLTPKFASQYCLRLVTSTVQPPVEGRHRSSSCGSLQPSNTKRRGNGFCQSEFTNLTFFLQDLLLFFLCIMKVIKHVVEVGSPKVHPSGFTTGGDFCSYATWVGEVQPVDASFEVLPVAMDELAGELSFSYPAQPCSGCRGYSACSRAYNSGVSSLQICCNDLEFFFPPYEDGISSKRHCRARRQSTYSGPRSQPADL